MIELRDYQIEGVNAIRASMAKKRSVLFVMPTGAGKTVVFSYIATEAAKKNNRVVILQHRKELIRQASLSLGGLGLRHQVISPPDKIAAIRRTHVERLGWPMIDVSSPCSVASIQTLARRINWIVEYNPRIIIADEAHHALAGTWRKIIDSLPETKVLGVTATPCRTNGQGLGDIFDDMILGPSMKDLIARGSLVRPRVFTFGGADTSQVKHAGDDFNTTQLAELLESRAIVGDAIQHYRELAPGRPAIVFCPTVRSAERTAEQFRAAGFNFQVVTGEMDDDLRDQRILGLGKTVQGIVTVDVISEGVDIPCAEVAILLRSTESLSLYLQQCGRVLRPAPGKEYGLILDHSLNVARHGMPDADREWSLTGRPIFARGPNDDYDGIVVMQCPKCLQAHEPAPACPYCGHVYPPREHKVNEVAGSLEEVFEQPESAEDREKRIARQMQGQASTVQALVDLGHDPGRAGHIVAARAEKDALRAELSELIEQWIEKTGGVVLEKFGFPRAAVRQFKPKQLKENIEILRAELLTIEEAQGHIEFMEGAN